MGYYPGCGPEVRWLRRIGWALIAVVAFVLGFAFLTGCGGAGEDLRPAVKSGAEFAVIAEPAIRAASRAEEHQCLAKPPPDDAACVAAARAKWDPIIDAYDRARKAWCAVDATIGQGKCQ